MVAPDKIISTAMKEKVDVIGLSGLITPSLDEMVHIAKELERLNCNIPLMIGGATTSQKHTAVKIEENYSGPTIHVIDASRAVGVVGNLLNENERENFIDDTRKNDRGMGVMAFLASQNQTPTRLNHTRPSLSTKT